MEDGARRFMDVIGDYYCKNRRIAVPRELLSPPVHICVEYVFYANLQFYVGSCHGSIHTSKVEPR